MSLTLLEIFDTYTNLGLKIIPLHPKKKQPLFENWQFLDFYDLDLCRQVFKSGNFYNMGLLLGELIDVEGDTEAANQKINLLTSGVPHPVYKSSKSIHHLFKNPDPSLTRRVHNHIEFRAFKHQSVLPPSIHEDGSCYQWLAKAIFPVPEIPKPLYSFYRQNCCPRKEIKPNHRQVLCGVCNKKFFMDYNRYKLEKRIFNKYGNLWGCHKCRDIDVRKECRYLKKKAKNHQVRS